MKFFLNQKVTAHTEKVTAHTEKVTAHTEKVTAHTEKVTAHVDIAYRRLERTFLKKHHFLPKSYGAIIDILHISEENNIRYVINEYGDNICGRTER